MTKKSEDAAAQGSLADNFATTMPAWMPGGLDDEVSAAAEDSAGEDAAEAAPDDAAMAQADGDAPDTGDARDADGGAADGIVVLPPKARLPQIDDIMERLTAAIHADELVIDAREVEDITTPVVTAIISALNTRADKTPPAAVLAPTPAFVDAFSDLGLFQDLMKMEFRQ